MPRLKNNLKKIRRIRVEDAKDAKRLMLSIKSDHSWEKIIIFSIDREINTCKLYLLFSLK